jgi:hypothetical protein
MAQRLARNHRLKAKNAPRCKLLMLFSSSPVRPERTSRLLSCHRSVGGLRPASPALSFAKLRSDKNQAKRPGSSSRADSQQPVCQFFGGRTCVMFARSTKVRTPELQRRCPLFAERMQEGGKQTGLGRPW